MAMTKPQINFCERYLANGYNALDAYFSAFPDADKTNRKPSYPYTLLKKPEIKEYIECIYAYDLNFDLETLQREYTFKSNTRDSVPVAIYAFLCSNSFNPTFSNASLISAVLF